MVNVTSLWRHPIKSHGREALAFVDLVAGQSMPWDRHWAVTHIDYPSILILNSPSHAEVSNRVNRPFELERWCGNIWLDGMAAWQERDWIGKDIQIGNAVLHVKEPIKRCMHTAANPNTGVRDVDTLAVLRDNWDHQNFGIYAEVIRGGNISLGDTAEVL